MMRNLSVKIIDDRGPGKDGIWIVGPNGEWLAAVYDQRHDGEAGDILLSPDEAKAFAAEFVRRWNEAGLPS